MKVFWLVAGIGSYSYYNTNYWSDILFYDYVRPKLALYLVVRCSPVYFNLSTVSCSTFVTYLFMAFICHSYLLIASSLTHCA